MKLKQLTSGLVLSASALMVASLFTPPAQAQATSFVCGVHNSVPATLARTPQGDVPVIRWVSDHFDESGYTPQRRCEEVSNRFQEYYSDGRLNFLTTGRKNGMNIVCVAQEENGGCTGQLFTLKPGSNPGQTLSDLMAVRVRASGPLNESSSRVYIDMAKYVEDATAQLSETTPTDINSEGLW